VAAIARLYHGSCATDKGDQHIPWRLKLRWSDF
jgi:hypothetical protein